MSDTLSDAEKVSISALRDAPPRHCRATLHHQADISSRAHLDPVETAC